MKIKTVLKALFLAYAITGAFLFLLAFLVFQLDLGEGACRRRHSGDICGLLFRRWFHGGKADAPG